MKITGKFIFVGGRKVKSKKDGDTYYIVYLVDRDLDDLWNCDLQQTFIAPDLFRKFDDFDFGDEVQCFFNISNGKLYLIDIVGINNI